jgi:hypothetical protein
VSLKSGWCIDEVMYMGLDKEAYAAHLHSQCNREVYDCPNHDLTMCANGDKVQVYHNESEET